MTAPVVELHLALVDESQPQRRYVRDATAPLRKCIFVVAGTPLIDLPYALVISGRPAAVTCTIGLDAVTRDRITNQSVDPLARSSMTRSSVIDWRRGGEYGGEPYAG